MLPFLFRHFALLAAGINLVQLSVAWHRAGASGQAPAVIQTGRRVALVQYGGLAFAFAIVALCQTLGRYPTPLFFFAPASTSAYIWPPRLAFYALWAVSLWGIWRPGVAEAALALGTVRATWAITPAQLRLVTTATVIFAALAFTIAPSWVPPSLATGEFPGR